MIPTRAEISDKIDELIANPTLNREDFPNEISKWLDTLNMPSTITIAEQEVNPKEQILSDLISYANY